MDLPASDGNWAGAFQPLGYLGGLKAQQDAAALKQNGQLTIDTDRQRMETENKLAPYKIKEAGYTDAQAGRQNDLNQQDYENQMVAQVAQRARGVDPQEAPQVWDDGMRALGEKGIKVADQYVGHYRADLADHVYETFGGGGGKGGARGGGGGGAAAAPAGFDTEAFTRSVATMPTPALQKSLTNLNTAIEGFNRITDANSWNAELQALRDAGIPVQAFLPNTEWNPMNYAAAHRLIQGLTARRDIIADRVAEQSVGLPGTAPKPMYEPQIQYIGTNDKGQPIGMDTHTGKAGPVYEGSIMPKPSAGMSTFQLKQRSWLEVHPGDTAGALEFANGKRRMEPAQLQAEALKLANNELYDITMAGTPPANPDAWVRNRAAQLTQQLTEAGAAPRGAPGGAGAARSAARPTQGQVQATISAARAALKAHPEKRSVIIARLKAAGVPVSGL